MLRSRASGVDRPGILCVMWYIRRAKPFRLFHGNLAASWHSRWIRHHNLAAKRAISRLDLRNGRETQCKFTATGCVPSESRR